MKRALTIGGISLALVLMIGVAAFAGSLGKRIAHDSDSGRDPEVSAKAHVRHPRVLRIKIRAAPEAKIVWDYNVICLRRPHGSAFGVGGTSSERHPPRIVKVKPTVRDPYECDLDAHATYERRTHGRLVVNLYAKK